MALQLRKMDFTIPHVGNLLTIINILIIEKEIWVFFFKTPIFYLKVIKKLASENITHNREIVQALSFR
jgi:hypothetical protein